VVVVISQVEGCWGSGALCNGTPGSWQPDFTVESLLNVIVINMVRSPTMLLFMMSDIVRI
jgi:hypothetical protein